MLKEFRECNAKELETLLNTRMVNRAKINDEIVEILRTIESKGLTIEPESKEFTGKYFLVVERRENEN